MVAAAGIVQLPTAAIVVALPTIHAEFDASLAELQWTVTAFYIPFAAFLIAAGRLADVFGRRRSPRGRRRAAPRRPAEAQVSLK
jgi:MFS family permease